MNPFLDLLSNRQTNRLLRLSFPNQDGPDDAQLLPQVLNASEHVSKDFDFLVELISDNAELELKQLIGKMVTIELVREDGTLRYFNGYVFRFSLDHVDGSLAYYKMQLCPWLAYLSQRHDNYLFHGKSLQDQTEDIFADYPIRDSELRIQGADPVMTDACQFAESDYNYLHRRWEAAGWLYWYEHRADGHTLILADQSDVQCPPIDGEAHMPWQAEGGSQEDDGIHRFTPVRTLMPTHYAASSFDFKQPRPLLADIPTTTRQGDVPRLEVYEYTGAYGFKNQADGEARISTSMEALEAWSKRFEATANDRSAQPGRCFTLTGHFAIGQTDHGASGASGSGHASDAEFLILDVFHFAQNNYQATQHGGGAAEYRNVFTCLRKKIPWRPARGYNSQDTRIYGLQTALVTGPAGEEIHTDEYGRVRVQFHWDRVGQFNEQSSAWIRVASAWAGSSFGMTSIPRIGTEVIVQFLDGNPDRPLITGMVPNAATMPAWSLPANKTQSGILSRSTPGGNYDTANAIRFEDKKGAEQLWLHAEKDQLTEVEHDEDKWVGHDRRKTIDHDETSHIKHDRTETVDHNETITVHNNRSERVDHDEAISIGDNRTEDVGKNETIHIGQNRSETVGASEDIHIGSNRSVKVGGNKSETVSMMKTETIGLAKMLTVGGAYQTTVGAAMNTTVALMQAEQVGLSKTVNVGQTISFTAGEQFKIAVGKCTFIMNADGRIEISGTEILIRGQKKVEVHGDDVDTNPVS
ncbi:type VI secretion system tip protein VgrG [Undibacterium sp. Jales W-56]|uniref:type VI secretion system Vgr family protein n=1 Tax=Undibacterium sp. Jales W-56 TaxID=2897325 RepID=UPI0021D359F7|nr:type VI secretion system tip protein TssI/VgrG [Undibacterium sp. Jales W-56]MCU6432913.1 type VI secretion system tip protein VgrG [Undibacterium sp. Jales W-56]